MKKTIFTSPEAKRAAEETRKQKNPIECFLEAYVKAIENPHYRGQQAFEEAGSRMSGRKIFIKARRGRMDQQLEAIGMIGRYVEAMKNDERAEKVMADGGIATGIANTMLITGLLDRKELAEVIAMIDWIGKEKLESLAAEGGRKNGKIFSHILHGRRAETV